MNGCNCADWIWWQPKIWVTLEAIQFFFFGKKGGKGKSLPSIVNN